MEGYAGIRVLDVRNAHVDACVHEDITGSVCAVVNTSSADRRVV